MGTTHWSKISGQLGRLKARRVEAVWDNASNQAYKDAVERVCAAIKRAFPLHVDTSKIQQCCQAPEETVQDYYERLHETFNRYSGLTEPATRGDAASTWESHMTNSFLNGLCPELSAAVKHSCIGWQEERLDAVRRHAVHAQERMMEGQSKKKQKQETTLQLALIQATQPQQNQVEENQQKQVQFQGNKTRTCRLCGRRGHLARRCPTTTCRRCLKIGHWAQDCKVKPNAN